MSMNFNMIASSDGGSWYIWIILIAVFVVMILMTVIPQRKQKKRMQEMMSSMEVGDKIMTIGGFIGTIVEINTDNDRLTINVGSEDAPVNVVIEAAVGTQMTGGPLLDDLDGECVHIAVGDDADDMLNVAARFALAPQFFSAARPEACSALLNAYFKAFAVHIGQSERFFGVVVDDNGGDEAVFIKFKKLYV